VNFKLGIKYGPAVWKAHNARTESLVKKCDLRMNAMTMKITSINQRRKLQQEKARVGLERLQAAYTNLVGKNASIVVACLRLEAEIQALTDEHERQERARTTSARAGQSGDTRNGQGAEDSERALQGDGEGERPAGSASDIMESFAAH
jgi:hypothetical protein